MELVQLLKVGSSQGFCYGTREVWGLVGHILNVAKIILIAAVIIFGVLDFGKAVVASKDDEIKKSAKSFVFRIISCIIIFFIPNIVATVFTLVNSFADISADFDVCSTCIKSPGNCPK